MATARLVPRRNADGNARQCVVDDGAGGAGDGDRPHRAVEEERALVPVVDGKGVRDEAALRAVGAVELVVQGAK